MFAHVSQRKQMSTGGALLNIQLIAHVNGNTVCVLPVAERCAVALGDLLHLVVVSQHKERLLELAHFLHFGHHVLVDPIHDLLHQVGKYQLALVTFPSLFSARAGIHRI